MYKRQVIALIRKSENPKAAKAALMERFALSDAQAQAILDMRLQRLTNLEILALRKEYEDLKLSLIHILLGLPWGLGFTDDIDHLGKDVYKRQGEGWRPAVRQR